ncbi:MAG TPA: hypothetical protein ENI98_06020 [Gammaproteobacteria bacterium]|nr:hypothetical protein [Gammaproteobacteria bacterium]
MTAIRLKLPPFKTASFTATAMLLGGWKYPQLKFHAFLLPYEFVRALFAQASRISAAQKAKPEIPMLLSTISISA